MGNITALAGNNLHNNRGRKIPWVKCHRGRCLVSKSNRETLSFLKQELAFLERGGYGGNVPWRPVSIFLDSPSCPNRLDSDRSTPCQQCWLFAFVPDQYHEEPIPCHRIALNPDGESVHTMSRQYTPGEVEDAVRKWLLAEIRRLEEKVEPTAAN